MKKTITIILLALLCALVFSMMTESVYAAEDVMYGINNYDKVYVNKTGIMALSKGDVFKIDGEFNGHYYTITKTGNVFFVPIHRIDAMDKEIHTEEYVEQSLERQLRITNLAGFTYSQLGKPYLWGGRGLIAFDCSSLTQEAYKYIGYSIPRTSREQSLFGKSIKPNDLQIGDLVFFKGSSGVVSHVGMYIGEGDFIHSSSSRKGVVISNLTESYYRRHIVGARRIIE